MANIVHSIKLAHHPAWANENPQILLKRHTLGTLSRGRPSENAIRYILLPIAQSEETTQLKKWVNLRDKMKAVDVVQPTPVSVNIMRPFCEMPDIPGRNMG